MTGFVRSIRPRHETAEWPFWYCGLASALMPQIRGEGVKDAGRTAVVVAPRWLVEIRFLWLYTSRIQVNHFVQNHLNKSASLCGVQMKINTSPYQT